MLLKLCSNYQFYLNLIFFFYNSIKWWQIEFDEIFKENKKTCLMKVNEPFISKGKNDLRIYVWLFAGNSREYPNPDFTGWETHGGRINFLHDAIGSRACNSYPRQADHGAVSYRAFPSLIFGKVRNANVYFCERGKSQSAHNVFRCSRVKIDLFYLSNFTIFIIRYEKKIRRSLK